MWTPACLPWFKPKFYYKKCSNSIIYQQHGFMWSIISLKVAFNLRKTFSTFCTGMAPRFQTLLKQPVQGHFFFTVRSSITALSTEVLALAEPLAIWRSTNTKQPKLSCSPNTRRQRCTWGIFLPCCNDHHLFRMFFLCNHCASGTLQSQTACGYQHNIALLTRK